MYCIICKCDYLKIYEINREVRDDIIEVFGARVSKHIKNFRALIQSLTVV